ncbi:MAG: phytochelatin synthase family protein [Alphaproteobacteria bacterium]|nr:phytochelatin synthase family protein [Alphaproteobacteria bacterium]
MRRLARTLLVCALLLAGAAWWMLIPRAEDLPLPPGLIALESPAGRALLEGALTADLAALQESWRPQRYRSYCGVASAVAALGATGLGPVDQAGFFTPPTRAVRARRQVLFGGMSLAELGGLLAAHGAEVQVRFAEAEPLEGFLREAAANLGRSGDVLLVNYQRGALEQSPGGHISPVAAWAPEARRLLILDTADTRYPPVWAPVEALWAGMSAVDPSSGRSRGYVEVTHPAATGHGP